MSDKMWCPACESQTSRLTECYRNGEDCEYCGLSHDAWAEILLIQAARNDDKMALKFTELRVANDNLKRELALAENRLEALRLNVRGALG